MSIFSTLEAFKDGLTGTLSRSGAADVCHGWAAKIEDGAPAGDQADVIGDGEIIDEAGEPDADELGQ